MPIRKPTHSFFAFSQNGVWVTETSVLREKDRDRGRARERERKSEQVEVLAAIHHHIHSILLIAVVTSSIKTEGKWKEALFENGESLLGEAKFCKNILEVQSP